VNKQLTDEEILEKYREVFECYAKDGVIDLDKRLKFSFFCQIHRLEQVVSLVIIPKRTIHSTLYESQQCSGYVLTFNIDFFLHQTFPRKYIVGKKVFKASLRSPKVSCKEMFTVPAG
jgi:hypothetical protein